MPASPALMKHDGRLADRLRDPAVEVRRAAAEAAAWLGGPLLASRLVDALCDPDPEVRTAAIASLAEIDEPASRIRLRSALLGHLLEDPSPSVRVAALRALPVRALAAERLEDAAPEVRQAAFDVLRLCPPDEASFGRILERMGRDESPELRASAVTAWRGEIPRLVPFLDDPEPSVVEAALRALAGRRPRPREVLEKVASLLVHADAGIRAQAVRTFLDLRGPATRVAPLHRDPDPRVREAVLEGLKDDGGIIDALLRDPAALVRQAAVRAAARMGEAGVHRLRGALSDDHPDVRSAAVDALRRADGVPVSIRASWVAPLLSDGSSHVRAGALEALGSWKSTEYRREMRGLLGESDDSVVSSARRALEALES